MYPGLTIPLTSALTDLGKHLWTLCLPTNFSRFLYCSRPIRTHNGTAHGTKTTFMFRTCPLHEPLLARSPGHVCRLVENKRDLAVAQNMSCAYPRKLHTQPITCINSSIRSSKFKCAYVLCQFNENIKILVRLFKINMPF